MTKTAHHQQLTKRALIAAAALLAVAACSTSTRGKPAPSSNAPAAAHGGGCEVNPSSAPVPTAEEFEPVPEVGRISVALSGITSGEVQPGDPPTEVDVAVCNNSAVDYPQMGVVLVLQHCSCATYPNGIPLGTVERFDQASGGWVNVDHPAEGSGMDYLGTYSNVQELPKGKSVTLRYRVALDASMTAGKGGVEAIVVTPDPLVQIGKADLPFTVLTGPNDRSNGPTPPPAQQTLLPFTGLTYPRDMAVDATGDVYVTDSWSNRVLKLAAGSNQQTVLPFTGLDKPGGVAVDGAGDVFVADGANNRVLKLAAGSKSKRRCRLRAWTIPSMLRWTPAAMSTSPTARCGSSSWSPDPTSRPCCRSRASSGPVVWQWTARATSSCRTPTTTGCSSCRQALATRPCGPWAAWTAPLW